MKIPKACAVLQSGVKLTPMMAQYWEIKKQYPNTLVLFRMGDFYELFFEDAQRASEVLNIALTYRGKIGDVKVPMAGIPHHAAPNYLDRLTAVGLKAAICEQVEDPSQSQGIVKRAVTQVIGPSLPYDIDKSDSREHHYIACAVEGRKETKKSAQYQCGQQITLHMDNPKPSSPGSLGEKPLLYIAFLDYTTGDFWGTSALNELDMVETLALHSPKEFLCFLGQWESYPLMRQFLENRDFLSTHISQDHFSERVNGPLMKKLMGKHFLRDPVLNLNKDILPALAALSFYICSSQCQEDYHHIRPFRMEQQEGKLRIALSTLKGIEILPKSKDTFKESLLGFFDRTKSSMGSREMRRVFQNPLGDMKKITERQDFIKLFLDREDMLKEVREELSSIRDLERILVKLTRRSILAGDLLNLSHSILVFQNLREKLQATTHTSDLIEDMESLPLDSLYQLAENIQHTINDEPGAHLDKGNLIREGAHPERDHLKALSQNSVKQVEALEKKYRSQYNLGTLRIKHNNILGYFIEISRAVAKRVPEEFHKKQTLVNSERFTSDELQDLERELLYAQDLLQKLEQNILGKLLQGISQLAPDILTLSQTLGTLDVLSTMAWVARVEDLNCPQIFPDRQIFKVEKGEHPLIKALSQGIFVPHDIHLDKQRYFALITGPNMAGKTTVMREMAIIQFLAQVGSFVPAASAQLGLCDYLFSRLGASDDILNGQSTFMVEMSETASILRHATSRSLIILDEVGRGTSTYDGMSIAWALVEFFVRETKALCLFSTHYHELIELVENLKGAVNLTVETVTQKGEVKFLYRLVEGGAQESFGLYVAQLAGLPSPVLQRSQEILNQLEQSSSKTIPRETTHVPAPGITSPPLVPPQLARLKSTLESLNVMEMTPMQALQKLQELQQNLQ